MDANTFQNKFKGRNLNDKYEFLSDHYNDTELFTGNLALSMVEELYRLSPRGDREQDFVDFVDKIKKNRPDLYQEFPAFTKFKTIMKLGTGNVLSEEELTELSEKYTENPDMVDAGWSSLQFHGPLEHQVQFVQMTAPQIKKNKSITPSSITDFIRTSIHTEIFRILSEEETFDSAESVVSTLRDRIDEYIKDSPVEEFPEQETVEWVNGITGNTKMPDDDAEPSAQYRHASRHFTHYLREKHGYVWLRASLASNEICRYFLERLDGDLAHRDSMMDSMVGKEKKEPSPDQADVRPEQQFLPEEDTFQFFLKNLLSSMKPQYYTVAALVLSIPHWLDFTVKHSLSERDAVKRARQKISPIYDEVSDQFRKWFPDRLIHEELDELVSE